MDRRGDGSSVGLAAGSTDRAAIQSKILEVANAPGEKIGPTELAKGLKLLADGKAIDYQGRRMSS